jgi:4-hydroxy-3-methylbut-2-enyl diphosphate reductase
MSAGADIGQGGPLTVYLAAPRGFCAGVVRAVDIVDRALDLYGAPVYVRHEIVHNIHVVERLKARGAIFVAEVDQVPTGAVTIFSAHGVSRKVEDAAEALQLDVIDATCPLVSKVHNQGRRYAEMGYDIVLIGHDGHAEVEGTLGQIRQAPVPGRVHLVASAGEVDALEVRDPERVAYITQTTLSILDTRDVIAALKARFPAIIGPDMRHICYATQNRQQAVLGMQGKIDLLLVVGSRSSSNTNRLKELGAHLAVPSHLVEGPDGVDAAWLDGIGRIGITAGASAPEELVQAVIAKLRTVRALRIVELEGIREDVAFAMPPRLTGIAAE